MTALPVAYYLKELSGEGARRAGRGFASLGAEETSDLELQISEAHARGVLEGRAAAQAEHEAAAATLAADFERKLAAERERWSQEEGTRFGEMIAAAFHDLEGRLSSLVSETLKPMLGERVRIKAVEELAGTLNRMLSKGEYAKIIVSGPADLLTAMEARLAGAHPGLSFVPADGPDLAVRADETILETRIGAWLDVIAGASQ